MGLLRLREFPHDSGPSTFSGFHEGYFYNYIIFRNARPHDIEFFTMPFAIVEVRRNSGFRSSSLEREISRGALHARIQFPQENRITDRITTVIIVGSLWRGKSNDSSRVLLGDAEQIPPARWSNFGRFSTASIPRPHARVRAAKLSAREICFRRSQRNGAEVACREVLSENICPYSVQTIS